MCICISLKLLIDTGTTLLGQYNLSQKQEALELGGTSKGPGVSPWPAMGLWASCCGCVDTTGRIRGAQKSLQLPTVNASYWSRRFIQPELPRLRAATWNLFRWPTRHSPWLASSAHSWCRCTFRRTLLKCASLPFLKCPATLFIQLVS